MFTKIQCILGNKHTEYIWDMNISGNKWLYIVMLKTSAYRMWSECYLTSTDLNEELHGKVCSPFSYLRWYNCNGYLPFFFYCMAKWCIAETLLILRSLETKLTMKVAFNTLFDIYIIIIHRHTFIISLYICIYYHIVVLYYYFCYYMYISCV